MTGHQQSRTVYLRTERLIVLQLLRDDHDERWSRAELETALDDVEPLALSDAIAHLERRGVVVTQGEHVLASPAVRRIDELELVGV
jgi:DNA-binding HxlR family transcriptional regulator